MKETDIMMKLYEELMDKADAAIAKMMSPSEEKEELLPETDVSEDDDEEDDVLQRLKRKSKDC